MTVSAAAFASAIGVGFGTYSAGDTDPFGYVSQADLIASGTLRIDLKAETLPVLGNEAALVPPGYVLGSDRQTAVPMYPPGLSMLMALLQHTTGERNAVFFVVPALAALAVLMTYRLGTRYGSNIGAMAAVLLATSPTFLLQSVQPVSDVAATAWWTTALVLVRCDSPARSMLAGLSVSLAVLTRPHLVPLAAVIGAPLIGRAWRAETARRNRARWSIAAFVIGSVPACLVIAFLNQQFHGSPFVSGYGRLSDLFRWEHVLPNLDRYPRWLLETQTPFIFLGLLAPFVLRRGRGDGGREPSTWLLLTFVAVIFFLTILYGYFGRDEWGYVRFLLPTMPVLLILSAVVIQCVIPTVSLPTHVPTAIVALLTIGLAIWQVREAEQRGVFQLHEVERRYVDVGRFIGSAMPQSSVFVAGLHSGSIRYYANRMTIHFPRLRQGSLDLAIRALHGQGREVYIALEDGERRAFTTRFETSDFARLDWPPAQQTSRGVPVSIWNTRDRAAFLSGVPIATGDIHQLQRP